MTYCVILKINDCRRWCGNMKINAQSWHLREETITPSHKPVITTASDHICGQELHRKVGKEWEWLPGGGACENDSAEVQGSLVSSTSSESYSCDRFETGTRKVRASLDSIPKWKAEPRGERAPLCMQDKEIPDPGASPAPAGVCDYALGPSARGWEDSRVSSCLGTGEETDH